MSLLSISLIPLGVPWVAAAVYTGIAFLGIVVAVMTGVPWKEMALDLEVDPEAPPRDPPDEDIETAVARFLTIRLARRRQMTIDIGLWLPFAIVLGAVGALIQLSGDIVGSPFSQVAAVVLTLVVLLIRAPQAPDPHDEGDEMPAQAVASVVVLVGIAVAFFSVMIAMHYVSYFKSGAHPDPAAEIVVSIATAGVGVGMATWSRWSRITGKVRVD
ncbi:MAG TPA: hypothetical protein VFK14_12280 [Solirubrobacterales bacterium]|nr:hypothetical protein [Solirubrobacterales bacterium]